jgi:hypothetical protein
MKRCPTCNRTFEEDWLAFCTQDGTTLVDDAPAKADEPPPTIQAPPPPPAGGWQQPSGGLGSGQFQPQPTPPPAPPANFGTPSGGIGSGQFQPQQQMQAGWQPPPAPLYVQPAKRGLAVASMICGICSVTIGWCCYFGVLSAPVAIGLGIFQLVELKKNPQKYADICRAFAFTGIITGALYFVGLAIIILVYGIALLSGGLTK